MYKLNFPIKKLPIFPVIKQNVWEEFNSNPWAAGSRIPQPSCKCGRGHIPTKTELKTLQKKDIKIKCECGEEFYLTEAFIKAICSDKTPESGPGLISDKIEVGTFLLTTPVGTVLFKEEFKNIFRVYLGVVTSGFVSLGDSPKIAVLYMSTDGFSYISSCADNLDQVSITYKAYGSNNSAVDWVKSIHSSRRLASEGDYDAAIAILGTATELFARKEFLLLNPALSKQSEDKIREKWQDYKNIERFGRKGLPGVINEWGRGQFKDTVFKFWKNKVWELRHKTFHGKRSTLRERDYDKALSSTLTIIFKIKPAAMTDLAQI